MFAELRLPPKPPTTTPTPYVSTTSKPRRKSPNNKNLNEVVRGKEAHFHLSSLPANDFPLKGGGSNFSMAASNGGAGSGIVGIAGGHSNNIISGSHINIAGGSSVGTNGGGGNNYHNSKQYFNHFNGFNRTSGASLSGGPNMGNVANGAGGLGNGGHRTNFNEGSGSSGSQTIHITNRAVNGAASISGGGSVTSGLGHNVGGYGHVGLILYTPHPLFNDIKGKLFHFFKDNKELI